MNEKVLVYTNCAPAALLARAAEFFSCPARTPAEPSRGAECPRSSLRQSVMFFACTFLLITAYRCCSVSGAAPPAGCCLGFLRAPRPVECCALCSPLLVVVVVWLRRMRARVWVCRVSSPSCVCMPTCRRVAPSWAVCLLAGLGGAGEAAGALAGAWRAAAASSGGGRPPPLCVGVTAARSAALSLLLRPSTRSSGVCCPGRGLALVPGAAVAEGL